MRVLVASRRQRHREQLNARESLRQRGLRATVVRVAILELLDTESAAVAHADLFARLEGSHDRTTVFRTLTTLTRAGLVLRLDAGDRVWRYRRENVADASSSASFACRNCRRITELAGLSLVMSSPPRAIARRQVDVIVRGICDRCE
ncbi:MAG TPA: transcriptional repressor [Kofleriaceae bacterium]|jgi:Fur family ferric uptake transcriptional regulator